MQILDACQCQLSNFEVVSSLKTWRKIRNEEQILPSDEAFDLETKLLGSYALRGQRRLKRRNIVAFLKATDDLCRKYQGAGGIPVFLTKTEKIQLLNVLPTEDITLDLLLDGMNCLDTDLRLGASNQLEFKEDIMNLVKIHLKIPDKERREETFELRSVASSCSDLGDDNLEYVPPPRPELPGISDQILPPQIYNPALYMTPAVDETVTPAANMFGSSSASESSAPSTPKKKKSKKKDDKDKKKSSKKKKKSKSSSDESSEPAKKKKPSKKKAATKRSKKIEVSETSSSSSSEKKKKSRKSSKKKKKDSKSKE